MKKFITNLKVTKLKIILLLVLIITLILFIKFLKPKIVEVKYWHQELQLQENIKIVNIYKPSFEVCYSGMTKVIIDWNEEVILQFPEWWDNYLKWCAIDIILLNYLFAMLEDDEVENVN